MKINLKTKKAKIIIGVVASISVVIGSLGFVAHGRINTAQNEYVGVESQLRGIRQFILERNDIILNEKDKLVKYDETKDIISKIEKDTDKIRKTTEFTKDTVDANKRMDMYEESNKYVNEFLKIVNSNEKIKNDKDLKDIIEEINIMDYNVDDQVDDFNNQYSKKFNDAIKIFPVNVLAEKNGVVPVDKIEKN